MTRFARLFVLSLLIASTPLSPASSGKAESQPAATAKPPALLLGSAWYPEQWPESRWQADIELMQKAHMHMVRVGEFAWTALEPEEGKYDLDWLERAINLAGHHGIYVILGTPIARAACLDGDEISGHHGHRRRTAKQLHRRHAQSLSTGAARGTVASSARLTSGSGTTLRPQSLCDRLADRQRVSPGNRSTPTRRRNSIAWLEQRYGTQSTN